LTDIGSPWAANPPPAVPNAPFDGSTGHMLLAMTATVDIRTREDCEQLVRAFYGRALADPILGFIFTDVAHLDLDVHVPRITAFWETVLLGAHTYSGGAFAPHARLNAKVTLYAVDEQFAGARANQAKQHAERVAAAFYSRLNAQPPAGADAGALGVTHHG
jgi:hemoglobin